MQIWRSAKLWRGFGWALVAIAVIWVALWAAFPWAAKSLLQKYGSQALGRVLTVQEVRFKPWTMELEVLGLEMAGAEGNAQPQASIARIYIDAELSSLLRWGPVVDAVLVESPHFRLAQTAPGQLDIQDILERFAPNPEEVDTSSGDVPRFAIYNIELSDGQLALDDQVAGAQHLLKDLKFSVPFVSSLRSKRQVKVLPHLSFDLNGSQFATEAQSTPFADDRRTAATLHVRNLDLKPYLPYWPSSLPLALREAVVQVQVQVDFEQFDSAVVRLSGHVRAENALLQDLDGKDWLQWKALQVDLGDVQPLTGKVEIAQVTLTEPSLALRLNAQGELLKMPAGPAGAKEDKELATAATTSGEKSGEDALNAVAPSATAQTNEADTPSSASPTSSPVWQVSVARWQVEKGKLSWTDESVRPAAHIAVREFALSGQDVTWPMQRDSQFEGRVALDGFEGESHARLLGHGTLDVGQVGLVLDGVPFEVGKAYVSQFLQPVLRAKAHGTAGLAWNHGRLYGVASSLDVQNLSLGESKTPLAAWKRLAVEDARIDMAQRTVHTKLLALDAPEVKVARDAQGRWMYETWLQKGVLGGGNSSPKGADTEPGWVVLADQTQIRNGVVTLEDAQAARPVRVGLRELNLDVKGLDSRMGKTPLDVKLYTQIMPVGSRGQMRSGAKSGSIDFGGQIHMAPRMAVDGKVQAKQVPVHLFESYMDGVVNMRLLSALASFDGKVRYSDLAAGPSVKVDGQAGLADVYIQTVHRTGTAEKTTMEAGEDLLRWKQLQLSGLSVDLQPQKPLSVQVQKTALRDFFARVVVQPNGRLNLQDLAGAPEEVAATADKSTTSDGNNAENKDLRAQTATENESTAAAPDPMAPRIVVGPVELSEGQVKFSDFFIQPNYTADLTQLAGSLSAFSSVPVVQGEAPAMADLVLKGVAQSTASLDISGKLNPLVQPLALDINGKVRDLELPPLSPYSVKYAGHGIERGKLSMDVHYQVQPNGMLTANNNLVLHQLTFGDAVKGAPASLPVKLAVALLADSNGVIDIDLPISGSLNDPQFRLGPVIFRVIGNLIRKAVTAPFALLAGAFSGDEGGGGDIAFAPGSSQLDAAAKAQLDKIAKSLQDRPALKLTVAGKSAAEQDAKPWKALHLEQQVQASSKEDADAELSEKEKETRLKSIYRKADIDKPRNAVGIAKSLPPEEMRQLLVEQMPLPPTAMQELAVARAMAVRSYLAEKGVEMSRLFLGDSQADGKDAATKAQLSLAVQ